MVDFRELFANGVTREGLKKLFNPYYKTKRINEDDSFSLEVFNELEQKTSYAGLKTLLFYITYLEPDREQRLENAIKNYLSFKENMPFFPTVEEWMKEISAPEDFIKKIISENGINLTSILGNNYWTKDLQVVFYKKIEEMEKNEIDNYEEGLFKFSDNYFRDYLSNKIPETVKKQWEKYLSKEFVVTKRFQEALVKREYYFNIAKEKHLTVIDTVMLFIDYAFDGYELK